MTSYESPNLDWICEATKSPSLRIAVNKVVAFGCRIWISEFGLYVVVPNLDRSDSAAAALQNGVPYGHGTDEVTIRDPDNFAMWLSDELTFWSAYFSHLIDVDVSRQDLEMFLDNAGCVRCTAMTKSGKKCRRIVHNFVRLDDFVKHAHSAKCYRHLQSCHHPKR